MRAVRGEVGEQFVKPWLAWVELPRVQLFSSQRMHVEKKPMPPMLYQELLLWASWLPSGLSEGWGHCGCCGDVEERWWCQFWGFGIFQSFGSIARGDANEGIKVGFS